MDLGSPGQPGQPGLPAPSKHTNDLDGVNGDGDLDTVVPQGDRDELSDALSTETEHSEAARLQEAENILADYISLLKDGPGKTNQPLLAK